MSAQPALIKIFFSYAPQDEALRAELETHLAMLKKQAVISGWHARDIGAGEDWRTASDMRLESARVILLLISADYIASDYCFDVEMRRALERQSAGEASVIPVVLRACDLHTAPFATEAALPSDQRPVTSWQNRDEAWADVVQGIRKAITEISGRPLGNSAQHVKSIPTYLDAMTRFLSEQLEKAHARKEELRRAGQSIATVSREMLDLRRQLREGGQLYAGDSLSDSRYLLLDQLGRGGFATVWRALDRETETFAAIKVLHTNLAADPVRRERFFRGARVMAELQHEALVRVLEEHGEDGGFYYFVMEFIDGPDLHRAVLNKTVPRDEVLRIILTIGEALTEAHERGIVHRDVKPANILLGQGHTPRLTDFDLVAVGDTTGGTRTGAMGTFLYAAPECMDRPQDAIASADVYGLGMTAIFCLYGKELPKQSFGHTAALVRTLECDDKIKGILNRSVSWDANARPADARAFCEALSAAIDGRVDPKDRRALQSTADPRKIQRIVTSDVPPEIATRDIQPVLSIDPDVETTSSHRYDSQKLIGKFEIGHVRPTLLTDPYIGTTFNYRYKIQMLINEGATGLVYLARHKVIDKKVAIKVLRTELTKNRVFINRLLQEAKAASTIGNPHIIDISDFGDLPDGSTYLVMEYLEGQRLSELIDSEERLSVARICHIAGQIADGLAAAHERGIIHRDLRPDNVFLIHRGPDQDFVKILDFRIAEVAGSANDSKLTNAGALVGTPHYMSPEQAAGARIDHRADIYALGVMLYELTSGQLPFNADNFMGILTQHMYKAPVPIQALVPTPDCPPSLEAVILKCLSKKQEARYQSMEELGADLQRIEAGGVPHAVAEMMARSGGFRVTTSTFKNATISGRGLDDLGEPDSRWPFAVMVGAVALAVGSLLPLPFRYLIVARQASQVAQPTTTTTVMPAAITTAHSQSDQTPTTYPAMNAPDAKVSTTPDSQDVNPESKIDIQKKTPTSGGEINSLAKEAALLLNRGERKDAIVKARQAIAADPTEALPYLVLGGALQDSGKLKDSVEAYCDCVRKATKGPVDECRNMGGHR